MGNIPEVPYRFGERYLVTDFIMVDNVAIAEQARELSVNGDNSKTIARVADWIRDDFAYPLDFLGNPSTSGHLRRHKKGLFCCCFSKYVFYMWGLPNEVLIIGTGICICTSNLAVSVLRAAEIDDVWVCLGDVRSAKDDTLVGRHAWVEVPYPSTYVLETTIHYERCSNLVPASFVYDEKSSWAQENGIYYIVQAKYNESKYAEVGPLGGDILRLMGLPANRVLLFGIEGTLGQSPKKLYREWRAEELRKERLLREAYRRM